MVQSCAVSCRVDYRPVGVHALSEKTTRLESMSATGCTIRTHHVPEASALELRIYLPGGEWPLRIDEAKVTWGHWDGFTVEFLSIPDSDQRRLRDYLATAAVVVGA